MITLFITSCITLALGSLILGVGLGILITEMSDTRAARRAEAYLTAELSSGRAMADRSVDEVMKLQEALNTTSGKRRY